MHTLSDDGELGNCTDVNGTFQTAWRWNDTQGGRSWNFFGTQPADGSSNHYKFTGKERDAESGLDYFGARYYAVFDGEMDVARLGGQARG